MIAHPKDDAAEPDDAQGPWAEAEAAALPDVGPKANKPIDRWLDDWQAKA